MSPSNHRLFLLDASSYLFRAYFAIGSLSNSKGIPTNATYGFIQMLLKLIKDQKPTHLVAVWDRPEPTFRKQQFEAYKAQREEIPPDLPEQIDWIKKILQAMKIPTLEKAGYEADDIIGTIAKDFQKKDYQIVVVTGDKDLMQLVDERLCLLDTMKDKWTRREQVIERFGVGPEKVIDVLGLAGDSSDNIPGVPGIGEKTASALIQQYGSVENLYEHLDELKGKRKENLEQNKEAAFLSKKLVTIHCDVPIEYRIEDFDLSEPDQDALNQIFKELEFTRLLDYSKGSSQNNSLKRSDYILIDDAEKLSKLLSELENVKSFALDTETTSLDVQKAQLVGVSLSTASGRAYYIPVGHLCHREESAEGPPKADDDPVWANNYLPLHGGLPRGTCPEQSRRARNDLESGQLDVQEVLQGLKPVFENSKVGKIGQNYKYDYQILKQAGIEVQGLAFDTMIASYLLDPAGKHGLDHLAQVYLNHSMISYEEVTKETPNKSFAEVSIQKALEYSAEDADATFQVAEKILPEIKSQNLEKIFYEIELPLVPVLAEMELRGIKIDRPYLEELQKDFSEKIQKAEKKIYELAGKEFNVNSPKQLGQILFEDLKLPVQRKTKTGYSTDVDVLTELAKIHPLPEEILSYRSLAKLKSTYIDALLNIADPKTDRVHTSFNQTIAETGRLSSSDPNLQNIPIRTDDGKKIRAAFIAEQGFQLLSADYSQIELRVLAHMSEDPNLITAFEKNEDVHRLTASSIFGLPEDQITSQMRAVGKTVNFAVIYGQTPFGLSGQLGIPQAKAREYIEQYFAKYPKVQAYREQVLKQASEKGEVRTLFGRRRLVADLNSKNPNVRSFAERIAFNTVIQGTAADLIKLAMIQIDQKIKEKKLNLRLLLQVHDELVFEVKENELDEMKSLVKQCMEKVASFRVPLLVEVGVGKNWNEAH